MTAQKAGGQTAAGFFLHTKAKPKGLPSVPHRQQALLAAWSLAGFPLLPSDRQALGDTRDSALTKAAEQKAHQIT